MTLQRESLSDIFVALLETIFLCCGVATCPQPP